MRKLFLLGTMLGVAGTALAFGGMFSHGSKSTTYKGGVDAIGVHYNGEGQADIQTSCPEHSAWSDEILKCECDTWYAMNEEIHQCEESCPTERRCGTTCCGAGNMCVDGNKCCDAGVYASMGIVGECCNASESPGFGTYIFGTETGEPIAFEECCMNGAVPFIYGDIEPESGNFETGCCPAENIIYGTHCCPATSTGWASEDGCCPEGTIVVETEGYGDHCCPPGSTDWNEDDECI